MKRQTLSVCCGIISWQQVVVVVSITTQTLQLVSPGLRLDCTTRYTATKLPLMTCVNLFQVVPASCCILNASLYPTRISPKDPHCIFVPTSYNSHWRSGCLPMLTNLLTEHSSLTVMLIIIFIASQMLLILLAVCLCCLQTDKRRKTTHRIVLRTENSDREKFVQTGVKAGIE